MRIWEGGGCCAHPSPNVYLMYFSFCLLPTLPPQERLLWLIDLMEVPSFLLSGAVGVPWLGQRQGAVALPATPLHLCPALVGSRDSSRCSLSLSVCQSIRFFRPWSEYAVRSHPSSATFLLCDFRKWLHLSELSFRIYKMRMIISMLWGCRDLLAFAYAIQSVCLECSPSHFPRPG